MRWPLHQNQLVVSKVQHLSFQPYTAAHTIHGSAWLSPPPSIWETCCTSTEGNIKDHGVECQLHKSTVQIIFLHSIPLEPCTWLNQNPSCIQHIYQCSLWLKDLVLSNQISFIWWLTDSFYKNCTLICIPQDQTILYSSSCNRIVMWFI